jgi:hypothetical protein
MQAHHADSGRGDVGVVDISVPTMRFVVLAARIHLRLGERWIAAGNLVLFVLCVAMAVRRWRP